MNKVNIKNWAMSGSLLAILVIASTMAYFTSSDIVTNSFTVGEVSLKLYEDNYPTKKKERILSYGQVMSKDPKVKNDGKNDEVVFLRVESLVDIVELVSNDGKSKIEVSNCELFDFISTDGNKYPETQTEFDPNASFEYDKDWVMLFSPEYPKIETKNGYSYKVYWFGYKGVLEKNANTSALFDSVKLRNVFAISEDDYKGENGKTKPKLNSIDENIKIYAYGVQAAEMVEGYKDGETKIDPNENALTSTALEAIFEKAKFSKEGAVNE